MYKNNDYQFDYQFYPSDDPIMVNPDDKPYNYEYNDALFFFGSNMHKFIPRVTWVASTNVIPNCKNLEFEKDPIILGATLKVIYPNGGEKIDAGSKIKITWKYTNDPGDNIKIELCKSGVLYKTIIDSTPTINCYYDWYIPDEETSANNYSIRITSKSNPSITDDSDNYFTINPCVIEFVAEQYSSGSSVLSDARSFKDNLLINSINGKKIISLYYRSSPYLLKEALVNVQFRQSLYENVLYLQDILNDSIAIASNTAVQYTVNEKDLQCLNELKHLVLPLLPPEIQAEAEDLYNNMFKEDYAGMSLKNVLIKMDLLNSSSSVPSQ